MARWDQWHHQRHLQQCRLPYGNGIRWCGQSADPAGRNLVLDFTQNVNPLQDDSYSQLLKGAAAQNLTYVMAMGNTRRSSFLLAAQISPWKCAKLNFFQVLRTTSQSTSRLRESCGLLTPVELRMVSEWAEYWSPVLQQPVQRPA